MRQLRLLKETSHSPEEQMSARIVHSDLSDEILMECLADAMRRRLEVSPFNPSYAPGVVLQGEFLSSLTERLTAEGWQKTQRNQIDVLISPDAKVSVQVLTGGNGTGHFKCLPSSKNKRGKRSVELFKQNSGYGQQTLWKEQKQKHWIILFRSQDEQCFCELVFPVGVFGDLKTLRVEQRIVLPLIQIDKEGQTVKEVSPAQDVTEDIFLEVRPKA